MQVPPPEKEPTPATKVIGSASDSALRVTNLRKAFHSPTGRLIEVLRAVSFSIAAGQIVAIMGASGAGKSTLLHALGGLEIPDGGTIELTQLLCGSARTSGTAWPGNIISFVFQFHYLLADLTAVENVALPLMIARVPGRESAGRAISTLKAIGLGARLTHKVGDLSGGEQQRVAVARALITEPKLILADEPTGNLDASIAEEIGGLLVNYSRQRGAMVLIATHNDRLAALCDRVLLLKDGCIREVE